MSRSKEVAALVSVLDESGAVKKKRKNCELWAMNWLLDRSRFKHLNLLNFIRNDTPKDYKSYLE